MLKRILSPGVWRNIWHEILTLEGSSVADQRGGSTINIRNV